MANYMQQITEKVLRLVKSSVSRVTLVTNRYFTSRSVRTGTVMPPLKITVVIVITQVVVKNS